MIKTEMGVTFEGTVIVGSIAGALSASSQTPRAEQGL